MKPGLSGMGSASGCISWVGRLPWGNCLHARRWFNYLIFIAPFIYKVVIFFNIGFLVLAIYLFINYFHEFLYFINLDNICIIEYNSYDMVNSNDMVNLNITKNNNILLISETETENKKELSLRFG